MAQDKIKNKFLFQKNNILVYNITLLVIVIGGPLGHVGPGQMSILSVRKYGPAVVPRPISADTLKYTIPYMAISI